MDGDGNIKFTGIEAGEDGQNLWLYPQHGDLELKDNDGDSLSANQIEKNTFDKPKEFEMIQIVYDGTRNKWIIMNHN